MHVREGVADHADGVFGLPARMLRPTQAARRRIVTPNKDHLRMDAWGVSASISSHKWREILEGWEKEEFNAEGAETQRTLRRETREHRLKAVLREAACPFACA